MKRAMRQRVRTISNRIAQFVWRWAEEDGLSFDEFSRLTGVSESALSRPQGRLDLDANRRMTLLANDLQPRHLLAMETRLACFPELGAVWCNSPSMHSAFLSHLRYRDVLGEIDALNCQEKDGEIRFEFIPEDTGSNAKTAALANFELLAGIASHYARVDELELTVELAAAGDRRWHRLAETCPMLLHEGSGHFTLTLRSNALNRPCENHNRILDAHTRSLLDKELATLRQTVAFSSRVMHTLLEVLEKDDFALSDESMFKCSCDRLGMSRWTVQRYLQNEGLSFSALRRQIRIDEACRLLHETNLPLTQIGERLGFCSQSSFTRFFSSHLGQSPARYRKRA